MSRARLNVGVVGAGAIACDEHLPIWRDLPNARVIALADASPKVLAAVGTEFNIERRYAEIDELVADPSIDVVDVCLPSALHAQVTIAALAAGKHVLCEKPMAIRRADAAAMLEAQHTSGKQLMIVQNFRYDPSVQIVQRHIESSLLGHVYYMRCQWLRRRRLPGRPGFTRRAQSGGGPLYDLGVHMLDLAWWLVGCPRPVSATGIMHNRLVRRADLGSQWGTWDPATIDTEDFAAGMVRFEGGAVLWLETSWLLFQPESEYWRIQLFGDRAGIDWPAYRVVGETNRHPWDIQLPRPKSDPVHEPLIADFARAVTAGQPPPIPARQSANVVAMLEALDRSARSGREEPIEAFAL